jgi:beta-N-acetylhexosaminidase
LNGGKYNEEKIFNAETISLFTQAYNPNKTTHYLGWDSPSGTSSGGVYLSDSSYGHTGFTGTSLWLDPENDMLVILLTNAVHPNRDWKIPKYYDWRQRIHSVVYQSIGFTELNPNLKWQKDWNAE